MIEIRFHGRGGQGAVTSAQLVAFSAIRAGRCAQAFPAFGPERRGAPVLAFARVADTQIRNRSVVYEPDVVLVLDPSLLRILKVTQGLKEGGLVVINTTQAPERVREEHGIRSRLAVVDALAIAMRTLRRPIMNTTLLGALNRAAGIVDNKFFFESMNEEFGRLGVRNIQAFETAFDTTQILEAA